MQIFVRVVESGSFTRAANALDISRARVTEAIQDLEQLLGARLLHRTTRQLALTDDGRTYYGRVLQILADIEAAEAEIGQSRAEVRGVLRADMPVALTRLFVSRNCRTSSRSTQNFNSRYDSKTAVFSCCRRVWTALSLTACPRASTMSCAHWLPRACSRARLRGTSSGIARRESPLTSRNTIALGFSIQFRRMPPFGNS